MAQWKNLLLQVFRMFIVVALTWSFVEGHKSEPNARSHLWVSRRRSSTPRSPLSSEHGRLSRIVKNVEGEVIPPYNTTYYFDQLIDHDHPETGTFRQRYWHTWEFYKPGGPIYLTTPGESDADAEYSLYSLLNITVQGTFAQSTHGAAVVLEHRFFGESYPYPDLSPNSLKVLTISQAIEDLVYFTQNVNLPMPGGDTNLVRPSKTPWVLAAGSYSGALVAWALSKHPDIFWAGYASSAVVQPIADFWEYFEPIRLHMPQNCSSDVQAVVSYIDAVVASRNVTAIDELLGKFGFDGIEDMGQFLQFLQLPLYQWQLLHPSTLDGSMFYKFCDALEVRGGVAAPPSGWGLAHSLDAWSRFYQDEYARQSLWLSSGPEEPDSTAHGSLDQLSWQWIVCNEVGWVERGSPLGQPSIAFRQYTVGDQDTSCRKTFPGMFNDSTIASRVAQTASTYSSWNGTTDRLFVVSGQRDPWLGATLSAPGRNSSSTDLRPIRLTNGYHCSDWLMLEGQYDDSIRHVQQEANATMVRWVKLFTPTLGSSGQPRVQRPENLTLAILLVTILYGHTSLYL